MIMSAPDSSSRTRLGKLSIESAWVSEMMTIFTTTPQSLPLVCLQHFKSYRSERYIVLLAKLFENDRSRVREPKLLGEKIDYGREHRAEDSTKGIPDRGRCRRT